MGGVCPRDMNRRYSAEATSAEAAPPKPFNKATICGMAVICTVRAKTAPMAEPMMMPMMMSSKPRMLRSKAVVMMATNIPIAATVLPERAVAGWLSRLRPKMKQTAASR